MAHLWVPDTARWYTAKQMVDAARHRHYSAEERTLRTYVELGLLNRARRDWPGHGGGSSPGRWPHAQRELWLTLLGQHERIRQREGRAVHDIPALCNIPVWGWLYASTTAGVPLPQVRRVMRTWARAVRTSHSDQAARRSAQQLVALIAHPQSRERRKARTDIARMAMSGDLPDREDLRYLLAGVIDPYNSGAAKGPSAAPLSVEVVTDLLTSQGAAIRRILEANESIPDWEWEWARYLVLRMHAWYQQAQPGLARDSAVVRAPEVQRIFSPVDVQAIANSACHDLLLVLGSAPLAEQAYHLDPVFRPSTWHTERLICVVDGQPSVSPFVPLSSRGPAVSMAISVRIEQRGTL